VDDEVADGDDVSSARTEAVFGGASLDEPDKYDPIGPTKDFAASRIRPTPAAAA